MIGFFALLLILPNCEADHISLTASHWALPMKQHPPSFTAWSGPSTESPGWPEHSLSRGLSSVACPLHWGSGSCLGQVSHTLAKLEPGQDSQIHPQPLLILPIQTLSFFSVYWLPLPPSKARASHITEGRGGGLSNIPRHQSQAQCRESLTWNDHGMMFIIYF